jgi:hypothetical protein
MALPRTHLLYEHNSFAFSSLHSSRLSLTGFLSSFLLTHCHPWIAGTPHASCLCGSTPSLCEYVAFIILDIDKTHVTSERASLAALKNWRSPSCAQRVHAYACVRECVCACVFGRCMWAHACVYVFVRVHVYVHVRACEYLRAFVLVC